MFNPNILPKKADSVETPSSELFSSTPIKAVPLSTEDFSIELINKSSEEKIEKNTSSVIKEIKSKTKKVLENIIPDIRDNFEANNIPKHAEKELLSLEERAALEKKLFTFKGIDILDKASEKMLKLEAGKYICRTVVGAVNQGTRHPHDFIIESNEKNVTYYFIDPEHNMGKQKRKSILPRPGDIRPHVSTLVSLCIPKNGDEAEVSMLRFRTGFIEDKSLLKMSTQSDIARQIANTGSLPEMLQENKKEITFYLKLDKNKAEIVSRYVSEEDLLKALDGEKSSRPIEGKITSFQHIINRGLTLLEGGAFEKVK